MAWIDGNEYFWVVRCKNRGIHNKYNLFSSHAIPLSATDEFSPPPKVEDFTVQCDDCRQEYRYSAQDVLRAELEPIESLTPHPLFQQSTPTVAATTGASARSPVSSPTNGATTVLERIRSKVEPYLRLRHRETPVPYWRKPPQQK